MKTKISLLLLIILVSAVDLKASHYMGGEIIWECMPNGNFRFTLKVYRECAGIIFPNVLTLNSNSPAGNITMNRYPDPVTSITDLSPVCNPDTSYLHIVCDSTPSGSAYSNLGGVSEYYYTSDLSYPNGIQLNGVPPANGWVFSYSSCCRNPCTNITNSSSKSWFIRAIMYPSNNTNNYPCWDNSPVFAERPSSALCTGYPSTFSVAAIDAENDSLVYEWATPLEGANQSIGSYAPGYSFDSPLPDTIHNPNNVPVVLDPETGMAYFTSYTSGAFVAVCKVTAYKNGVKVSEIFRELQMVLLSCGTNLPPFINTNSINLTAPFMFTDTAFPGDTLNININVLDTFPIVLPNGQIQTLTIDAYGMQFGDNFTSDTSGCPFPPCATLNPPPPVTSLYAVSTNLQWEITTNHLNGGSTSSGYSKGYYDFTFNLKDDFCPAPGVSNYIYRVYVKKINAITNHWSCISTDASGNVDIGWKMPHDPDTLFQSYGLSYSLNPGGPYLPLGTFNNIFQTSFTHFNANAFNQMLYYMLEVNYLYNGNVFTDTAFEISSTLLQAPATVCTGDTFLFDIGGTIKASDILTIDFGQLNVLSGSGAGPYQLMANTIGTYNVLVQKTDSCGISSLQQTILANQSPNSSIAGTKFFCPGSPVILNASAADHYQWSTGDSTSYLILNNITNPTTIYLTVSNSNGCTDSTSVHIRSIQTYQNSEICMLSNDININRLNIIWEKAMGKDISKYKIRYQKESQPGVWNVLDSMSFTQAGIYTDTIHDPNSEKYFYSIQVIDSCGNISGPSPMVGSMKLTAYQSGNNMALSWLPYTGNTGNNYIQLYRYDSISNTFTLIDSVPQGAINYLDVAPPHGMLHYYAKIDGMNCGPVNGQVFTAIYSNVVSYYKPVGIEEIEDIMNINVSYDYLNHCLLIDGELKSGSNADILLFDGIGNLIVEKELTQGLPYQKVELSAVSKGIYFYLIRNKGNAVNSGKVLIW